MLLNIFFIPACLRFLTIRRSFRRTNSSAERDHQTMTSIAISRRAFSLSAATFGVALGAARRARSDQAQGHAAPSPESLGISTTNAAIHQEVIFKASPARVYHALTDPRQFDKIVLLSGAIKSMALASVPSRISSAPGGSFALFGGYITGRRLELLPNTRIVQAWRSAGWPPHIYSIARFELTEHPDGTKLLFDHTGFPNGEAASLATGWRQHYWEPLAKVLS